MRMSWVWVFLINTNHFMEKMNDEFTEIAKSIGKAILILNELEKLPMESSDVLKKKDIFFQFAYYCRVKILDKIELYNWSLNTPIEIPINMFSIKHYNLELALEHILGQLKYLVDCENVTKNGVNEILAKGSLFYTHENKLSEQEKESILILE